MRRLILFPILVLALACSDQSPLQPPVADGSDLVLAAKKKPLPALNNSISYVFVGHLQTFDGAGRLLVWEGEIHGDIEGEMKWWFVLGGGPPNMPDAAHVSFYEARWEIWDGSTLLLAGESGGTTARPPGKDGIWRGNGMVTEAYGAFEGWNGRPMFEGGNVNWTFPYSGQGMFRIN